MYSCLFVIKSNFAKLVSKMKKRLLSIFFRLMVDKEIDFVTAKFQLCSKMEFDRFFTLVVYNQPIIAERFFFFFNSEQIVQEMESLERE